MHACLCVREYVCSCVHVCVCVCIITHTQRCVNRDQTWMSGVFFDCFAPYFWDRVWLNLELIYSAKVADCSRNLPVCVSRPEIRACTQYWVCKFRFYVWLAGIYLSHFPTSVWLLLVLLYRLFLFCLFCFETGPHIAQIGLDYAV